MAMVVVRGTSWRSNSSRLVPRSLEMKVTPVKLAPGRLKLATRPSRTGSLPVANTTDVVVPAALATSAPCVLATITAALRPIRSANRAGSRSSRPSAQRCSITTLRPSTKPASPRPRLSAATMCSNDADGVLRRRPTTGMPACCARAASGHAAAPPMSEMNSRLLNRSNRIRFPLAGIAA